VSLFKEIKAEKVPTAKETKAINELQIKVVDAFVDAITYTGENGDLVNMVVVTDPKGMFLDLQEKKGFITKAEGGRELHVDAKYAIRLTKTKVETSTAEDLGDDNIIDEDEIMVDDDDLDGI
jgi:hypothetical protein